MAESGFNLRLVLSEYLDKSPIYNIQITSSNASIGTVSLSSPISPEYDGYGYITGVTVNIDSSILPYTSENLNIVQCMTGAPIYAYANLRNKHTEETFSDFQKRFTLIDETSTCYIHAISGEDIIFVTNKYHLRCAAAYGELECGLIRASTSG